MIEIENRLVVGVTDGGRCMYNYKEAAPEIFGGNGRVPCLLNWLHKSMHVLKWHRTNHESESHSVVFNSLWTHGLYSPWNSPGQNTGVGSHSLLQGIFPTQELNQDLLYCRQILYQLSYQGSPTHTLYQLQFSSFNVVLWLSRAFLVAQKVKNPPAMPKTWIWSLGWENPLEKGMATHSSILVWKIPWIEKPGRLQPTGS